MRLIRQTRHIPIAAAFILFVLVQVCLAAIVGDGAGNTSSATSQTTQTLAATIGSHANEILLGGYGALSTTDFPTSIKWNTSENLIEQAGATHVSGNSMTGIWLLKSPTATTSNVVLTFSLNRNAGIGELGLYNVDLTSTIRDSDFNGAAGSSALGGSITLTTVSGDVIMSCVYIYNSGGGNPGTVTMTSDSANSPFDFGEVATDGTPVTKFECSLVVASASSTQITWTWTTSNSADWSMSAVSVKEVAGGTRTSLGLLGVGR